MVAPITLHVRHIQGHTFTVEVDHDADTLGLKVVIWEQEKIAVDQQRLVFAGKELSDGSKLSVMGISDGAQLFLVEAGVEDDATSASVAVVPPAFGSDAVDAVEVVPVQSGSFAVQMPAPQRNESGYQLVTDDEASNERINAVLALAKYVRVYCIFGFVMALFATFMCCYWSALVAIFYLLGWLGTRRLNRCLLVFPMIKVFLTGFGGVAYLIFLAAKYSDFVFDYAWTALAWVGLLFLCFLHIIIFLCMCKLCCRISKLSRDEWCNARAKILARGCCC